MRLHKGRGGFFSVAGVARNFYIGYLLPEIASPIIALMAEFTGVMSFRDGVSRHH